MSEGSSSAIKPLPVKRRRRSFGGANGVWWRRRPTPKNNNTSPSSSSQSPSQSTSSPDAAEIEWDEDLCRPIYRSSNKTPPLESSSIVSVGGGIDAEDDSSPNASPTPSSPTTLSQVVVPSSKEDAAIKRLWTHAPIKRKKSFATRKRPYSFLLLESEPPSTSPVAPSTLQQEQEEEDSQSTSNASNASTTLSFSESSKDKPQKKKGRKRRILQKDEATLQKAKQFFDHLDKTQSLTLQQQSPKSSSSSSSSKITRTSHKLNLQSPRIQQEYQAYSKASQESGVTPYSIETYASSRRDFFRKRELFDGFLDD